MTTSKPLMLTIPEAAEAASVPTTRLRRWIGMQNDGVNAFGGFVVLGGDGDTLNAGRGEDSRLSTFTVLQIAIAGRLAERGVRVFDALKAGLEFAHGGEGLAGWTAAPSPDDYEGVREPGACFSQGETWLLIAGEKCIIANVTGRKTRSTYESLADAISALQGRLVASGAPHGPFHEAVVIMQMNGFPERIEQEIDRVLRELRPKNSRLQSKKRGERDQAARPARKEKCDA